MKASLKERENDMKIKSILTFLWELPQNALGYIILKVTGAESFRINWCGCDIYSWNHGGLSLGKYIFIPFEPYLFDGRYFPYTSGEHEHCLEYIKHEYGHSVQSHYLGWLYLPVIGLPSLIWCKCFEKYRVKRGISYYDFYTEKWADKLGGVERDG